MKSKVLVPSITALILLCCLLSSLPAAASESARLEKEANASFQAGNYPKALETYQQLLAIQRQQKDRAGEGWTLFYLGTVSQFTFQYPEALSYYEQALRLKQATKDRLGEIAALQALGGIYGVVSQFEKALSYFEQALALIPAEKNLLLEIGTRMSMNSIYVQLGQYDKMLENGQQQLVLARKMGNPFYEALALNSLGLASRMLEQTEQASSYYDQALAIQRQKKDKNGEVATLVGLGMFYKDTLQQPNKALEYFQQALAIGRALHNRVSESAQLSVIGVLYNDLKQYDQAVVANEQALQIAHELRNPMLVGAALLGLGVTYDYLGQYDKALPRLQEAQQIYQTLDIPSILWIVQRTLGKVESGRGASTSAISYYEQALNTIEAMRAGLAEPEAKTSFARTKLFVYDEFIELLKTLHDQDPGAGYDRKSLEIFERKQGRAFLEEVGKSGAQYFCGVPADVKNQETELENRLIETQAFLRQYRTSPDPGKFAEKMKGLEIQLSQIKSDQEILKGEIHRRCPDYYALKYPQPTTLTELQQDILKPPELMLVFGVMDQATYLWVIGKDKFGLFTLGAGEKALGEKVGEFRQGVEQIMQAIQQGQTEAALGNMAAASRLELNQLGRKLADLLLPAAARPLLADAQTLYIVPTGPLYGLPFEALTLPPAPKADPASTYLIEPYAVAYLSSASLLKTLRQTAAQKQTKAPYPLLAFANPVYQPVTTPGAASGSTDAAKKHVRSKAPTSPPNWRTRAYLDFLGGSFQELPDTEDEAKEIKQILQAPDQSQPLQLQAAASRSQVLRLQKENRLENYRYVVFACHGVLPGEVDQVRQPALVLSHPDPQTKGDGYLTMADIFGLKLNADLVSLSACNTGRGKLEKGEGVVGLTRAFMYAGTPALSVTLWSVESGSARRLNTGLYQNLEAKNSRAQALRRIKQEMIRGDQAELYRHPFFWAPLVLFGEGGS
jgi:CHAT domain-containing protein